MCHWWSSYTGKLNNTNKQNLLQRVFFFTSFLLCLIVKQETKRKWNKTKWVKGLKHMCMRDKNKHEREKEIEKLTRESRIFSAEYIVSVCLCILSITNRQMFIQLLCVWALLESDKCEMQPRDKQKIRQGKNTQKMMWKRNLVLY